MKGENSEFRNDNGGTEKIPIREFFNLPVEDQKQIVLGAGFHVTNLCAMLAVHPKKLERLFKRHFQRNPKEQITRWRAEMAKAILQSGKSLKWTAFELKFSQPSHLLKLLKS